MEARKPTIKDTVARALRHYGFSFDVLEVLAVKPDRIYARSRDWRLLEMIRGNKVKGLKGWPLDIKAIADEEHGTKISYREPGSPIACLQICLHKTSDPDPLYSETLELDCDYSGPSFFNPAKLAKHAWEVVCNAFTGSKTDQSVVWALQDMRFGKEDLVA